MKKYIIKWSFLILLMTFITSCNDDFLERAPLDALSEQTFFNSATDIQTYVNGFYGQLPRWNFQAGWTGSMNLFLDANSDLMINYSQITGGLDRVSNSGLAPVNSGDWNGRFDRIRTVNYLLAHTDKVKRDAVSNHFIGEGYFFRAWNYYDFLVDYGDLPYITEPLNVDSEELYRPRDSRYEVAKRIIQDLDSAIVNLSWKGVGEAKSGRVNKEAAIVMKARVALFEGTWEYYHGKGSSNFGVAGKDGKEFLNLVEPAIQELIAHQGTSIFNGGGPFNEPYNQLFSQSNCASVNGAFLFRDYNTALLNVSHNFYGKIADNGASLTKRLADMYLDATGVPQSISTKPLASLNEMGQNLDPRFRQTIWTPDRGPMTEIAGRTVQGNYALRYPLIAPSVEAEYTSTGFRNWKGSIFVESEYRAGNTDDILIRYAEGLLAYAEAKAILGTISQADLDKTVNVLRGRVGMVPMNLSTVSSWSATYSASEGFDPTASNVVNEIRRERTVELATEGFRLTDLKRWAVFEKAINGYKPKGARLQEFLDYFNTPATLTADGWTGKALTLTVGGNADMDADGYINPYFRSTQFQDGGPGFFINKDRDYLNAVPTAEIDLYEQSGVTLTQNPGWQ